MTSQRPGTDRPAVAGAGEDLPGVDVRVARPRDAAAIARLEGLSASTRRRLGRDLDRAAGAHAEVVVLVAEVATDHLDARPADDATVGPGRATDVGPGRATDVGPGRATDVGPGRATDVGPGRATDVGPGPATTIVGAALGQVLVDEGHVLDLAVDPAERGRGVGRQLLFGLLAALTERGARAHTLEVRPSNLAALALYRAAGFVVEGRRPRYYPDGEDALLLWRHDQQGRR